MRPLPALTFALALCVAAATVRAAEPQTDDEKALYALGIAMSQNIASFNLSDAELEFVKAGVADGAKGKAPKFDPQQYFPKLQEMQKTRSAAATRVVLDKAAAEKGAKRTASGLVITTIKEGKGVAPKATDTVKVHYQGTLPNGQVFDTERTGYPTQKPEGILRRIVQASTEPGDLVLDFFAGSGTTGAAAAALGRRYLLVDESPDAVAVMRNRLSTAAVYTA